MAPEAYLEALVVTANSFTKLGGVGWAMTGRAPLVSQIAADKWESNPISCPS